MTQIDLDKIIDQKKQEKEDRKIRQDNLMVYILVAILVMFLFTGAYVAIKTLKYSKTKRRY